MEHGTWLPLLRLLSRQPFMIKSAAPLKIGHPGIKSTRVQSSNELQWLDLNIGYQDSSPSYGRQGDMSYWQQWISTRKHAWVSVIARKMHY